MFFISKLIFLILAWLSLSACANEALNKGSQFGSVAQSIDDKLITPSLPAPKDKTSTSMQQPLTFATWLETLKSEARNKGVSEATLSLVQPYLVLNTKILSFDQQQPEFTQTFWTYLEKRLSELRVQVGRFQVFSHDALLKKIENEYGVPPEILAAFWGLETNYGAYLGDFSVLEALTTLAYDQRRSDFFRKELLASIMIIDHGNIKPSEMRGSWAGAVGQMQFMPSVYLKHAKDADGDSKADLWHSSADALTSAAAYLRAAGWVPNQPWLQQVVLPIKFDYAIADGKSELSITQLQQLGIKPISGAWLSAENQTVNLLLPAGYEGPAFVTWNNFKVIKRWNNSNNYALSVALLAQRIANNSQPRLSIPNDRKPWSRQFVIQLQEKLTSSGYTTEGTDGWFGNKTIQALRSFQKANNLPADGYPNTQTLELLNITP